MLFEVSQGPRRKFARHIINHVEHQATAGFIQGAMDEVEAPMPARKRLKWNRPLAAYPAFAAFAPLHGKSFFPAQQLGLLTIGNNAVATQWDKQLAVAEPLTLIGNFPQHLPKRGVAIMP